MITHQKDIEYFNEYPAPIMEAVHGIHFTNINHTITFFGPMLYFLVRALGCEEVLEIGSAEGYTAFYLAHAVKDNGIRYGMKNNHYYGIDIAQTDKTQDALRSCGLPATIIKMDTIELNPVTFINKEFDLIFQDGAHDTEHVLHELLMLYPQLKGNGKGYWIFHDCFGPAEKGFRELKEMIEEGEYNFEYVRLFTPYGLSILRKMDGFDQEKFYWKK